MPVIPINLLLQLNFQSMGALYGSHMFVVRNDAKLRSTTTENAKVFWKAFHDRFAKSLLHSSQRYYDDRNDYGYEGGKGRGKFHHSISINDHRDLF